MLISVTPESTLIQSPETDRHPLRQTDRQREADRHPLRERERQTERERGRSRERDRDHQPFTDAMLYLFEVSHLY